MRRGYVWFLLFVLGCAAAPPRMGGHLASPPLVRIKLLSGDSVWVGGNEPFTVTDGRRGRPVREGEWKICAGALALRMSDEQGRDIKAPLLPVWVYAIAETGKVLVNGKPYRGTVEVMPDSQGKLQAVNETDLETYLRGVVPAEIGSLDPSLLEAMKAQAVAARTYALKRLSDLGKTERTYDLESTVADQVYPGAGGETPLGDRVVKETRGEIVKSKGQPISAYYCSCCGGHTADIEEAWDKPSEEYLKGTKDPYCRGAKGFTWVRRFTRDQIQMMLDGALNDSLPAGWKGYPGRWKSLRVQKRGPSGRVRDLLVSTELGSSVLKKDRIRWAFTDPAIKEILPSTLFTVKMDEEGVTFSGNGRGHGVGMCQSGAIEMARQGKGTKDILRHYYRGIGVERIY
jgi:stage II sporulation protein D